MDDSKTPLKYLPGARRADGHSAKVFYSFYSKTGINGIEHIMHAICKSRGNSGPNLNLNSEKLIPYPRAANAPFVYMHACAMHLSIETCVFPLSQIKIFNRANKEYCFYLNTNRFVVKGRKPKTH